MSPSSRRPLGGRFVVALLIALVTATSAATAEEAATSAPTDHSAILVALHTGTDCAAAVPLRHTNAGGSLAAVAVGRETTPREYQLPARRSPIPACSRPATDFQPRGPPHPLSDL